MGQEKVMQPRKLEVVFLEPVKTIPKRKYKPRNLTYDRILFNFLESGSDTARINPLPGKFPKSTYAILRMRVLEYNHPVAVHIRGDDIYLKRNGRER